MKTKVAQTLTHGQNTTQAYMRDHMSLRAQGHKGNYTYTSLRAHGHKGNHGHMSLQGYDHIKEDWDTT